MDLKAAKYKLIEWLMEVTDESIIKNLIEIKESTINGVVNGKPDFEIVFTEEETAINNSVTETKKVDKVIEEEVSVNLESNLDIKNENIAETYTETILKNIDDTEEIEVIEDIIATSTTIKEEEVTEVNSNGINTYKIVYKKPTKEKKKITQSNVNLDGFVFPQEINIEKNGTTNDDSEIAGGYFTDEKFNKLFNQ